MREFEGLLTKQAWVKYKKSRQQAWGKQEEDRQQLLREYQENVRSGMGVRQAWNEYNKALLKIREKDEDACQTQAKKLVEHIETLLFHTMEVGKNRTALVLSNTAIESYAIWQQLKKEVGLE